MCLCLASKKPSEREFFVPAGTDLGVKLLSDHKKKTSLSDHFYFSGIIPTDSYVESDLFLKVVT